MTNEKSDPEFRPVKSVETAFSIISALDGGQKMGVTELADQLDISKTTVYHHLVTLKNLGYVIKTDGKYALGIRFLNLGKKIQTSNRLYEHAQETVDEVAHESGEMAHLIVEENGYAMYLYKSRGEDAIGRMLSVGEREHLHHSAGGKSILAHLPEDRIEEIIDRYSLPRLTENTIVTRDSLYDELETIRERGYSLNLEEEMIGVRAIGSPIIGADNQVVGALSISGPKSRMSKERLEGELKEMVMNGVNIIEIELNKN